MNSNTYFCSDLHLRHHNVIKFDEERWKRFSTIEEHNEYILSEFKKLTAKDTVYFLWDLVWLMDDDTKEWMHNVFFKSIKCKIHWILWNHDYDKIVREYYKYFETVMPYAEEKYEWRKFILCHYPLLSWNGMNRENSSIHIHWHSHKKVFFTKWSRYNIAYNWHKLLRHIDWFLDWTHKEYEHSISINSVDEMPEYSFEETLEHVKECIWLNSYSK